MTVEWNRLNNESNLWFNRFDTFRLLGPRRSIERAFNACRQSDQLNADRPGAVWYDNARRYNWRPRAEAWDEAERIRLRESDKQRREDARNHRIDIVSEVLDLVFERLIVDLRLPDNIDFATYRLLFKDMLNQNREDLPPSLTSDDTGELVLITADDLLAAQKQLASWGAQVRSLRSAPSPSPYLLHLRTCLLHLYPDPISARRVAEQAGLDLSRIQFSEKPVDVWHAILSEAWRNDTLLAIINVAFSEYPNNKELLTLCLPNQPLKTPELSLRPTSVR